MGSSFRSRRWAALEEARRGECRRSGRHHKFCLRTRCKPALVRNTDEGTVMSAVSFVFRTQKCLKVGLGCVTNIFGNEDVILCAL